MTTATAPALTTDVIEFDAPLAEQWLAACRFDHQRKPSQAIVKYYAMEMQRGKFKPYTAIELGVLGNEQFLIDGQHRLLAVVQSGIKLPMVVIKKKVNSYDEVAERYAYTDRGLRRTTSDQYAAISLPEELGLSRMYTDAVGAGVVLIMCNFSPTKETYSFDDKLKAIREFGPFAAYFFEIAGPVKGAMSSAIKRSSTIAVASVTLRYSAERFGLSRVEDFWSGVFADDGLSIGDPRKTANRHLMETNITGGNTRIRQSIRAHESARYLANCFNAYIENRKITYTRVWTDKPINIIGSPFDGSAQRNETPLLKP